MECKGWSSLGTVHEARAQLPHGSSFKFSGSEISLEYQVLQTLKEKLQLTPHAPIRHREVQSRVCQGQAEPRGLRQTHGAPWHEATRHGISKSQHQAAAEGMCLPGERAGTTRTQSLINGREMPFPHTWEPGLQSSPPPPALHCPPLPAVHSSPSTSTQQWERDCLSQGGLCCCTGEGASLGLASLTKPPLEAVTVETLKNVGTCVWGSRWGAGSQVNKLCTLYVELDGSTVGSLLVFSAPRQVFVPWLLYRETNLLLVRHRFMVEIKALRAFIFHHIILDDFACLRPRADSALSTYLKVNPAVRRIKRNLDHILHEVKVKSAFVILIWSETSWSFLLGCSTFLSQPALPLQSSRL